MKQLIILCVFFVMSFVEELHCADKYGHELTSLWKAYYKAEKESLPQKQEEILFQIREKAMKNRQTWDFYDASVRYLRTVAGRDWKRKKALQDELYGSFQTYGEPLLPIAYALWENYQVHEDLFGKVNRSRAELERSYNPYIYEYKGDLLFGSYADVLVPLLKNDYEYALWCLSARPIQNGRDSVYADLRRCVEGEYPKDFFAEYNYLCRLPREDRNAEMEALASRYQDRAVSLLPICKMLEDRLSKMPSSTSSDEYRRFRDVVEGYERLRRSYRGGIDARIAAGTQALERLLETMDAKDVAAYVRNDRVTMALRNVSRLKFRVLRDDEPVYEKNLVNESGSYYRPDTLTFELPAMDDGSYKLECLDEDGKTLYSTSYARKSLSMASRKDAYGLAVYVADCMTGKPVRSVEMVLNHENDEDVCRCSLDGFTYLPDSFQEQLRKDGGKWIYARVRGEDGLLRESNRRYIGKLRQYRRDSSMSAAVMTDRAAFNPSDTVRYKAVLYLADIDESKTLTAPEGTWVVVRLLDSDRKVLKESRVKTNGFGSVAGHFVLDEDVRNGVRYIDVFKDGSVLGTATIRVDSFVLPAYDLTFDEQKGYVLPGDTLSVTGKVFSYSGHSMSSVSASVVVRVFGSDKVLMHRELSFDGNGAFRIDFETQAGKAMNYAVEVNVTDAVGETQTFRTMRQVSDTFTLNASLKDRIKGKFFYRGRSHENMFVGDSVTLQCKARQSSRTIDGLQLIYGLYDGSEVVRTGNVLSGDELTVDMTGLPSGLYELSLRTVMKSVSGDHAGHLDRMPLLKVNLEDKCLDQRVENVYYVDDEDNIYIGSGCGPAWYAVEMIDEKGVRRGAEVLYVNGGISRITYEYGQDIAINMLRFFNAASHEFTYKPMATAADNKTCLVFGRFEDRTLPGKRYTYSVRGFPDSEMLVSVYDVASDRIRSNRWPATLRTYLPYPVHYDAHAGGSRAEGSLHLGPVYVRGYDENDLVTIAYGTSMSRSAAGEEAIPFQLIQDISDADIRMRTDFSKTLLFEPFLRPDDAGWFTFDVNTSDRLSTFVVSAFAHDRSMNLSVLRREFIVTVPVKVSVSRPEYLYVGDRYVMKADVSNSSSGTVNGRLSVEVYDTSDFRESDPVKVYHKDMAIGPGESLQAGFELDVTDVPSLGFKLVFDGGDFSDGLFVDVPVYPAEQEMVEAHSAVLMSGTDTNDMLDSLRSRFVNTAPTGAEYTEKRISELFEDMIPAPYYSRCKDAVSQSEAMYVNLLAAGMKSDEHSDDYVDAFLQAASDVLKCTAAGGGIAWFSGGKPSPFVTALVLDRYASLRDRDLLRQVVGMSGKKILDEMGKAITAAVGYLDRTCLDGTGAVGLSTEQYVYVRTRYMEIPFEGKGLRLKNVKAAIRQLEGDILGKVMSISIVRNFPESDRWMRKRVDRNLRSLKEYAVGHPSGGLYYPNAVMPWRGFIESEAFTHAMICNVLRDMGEEKMADGICLWLMIQKENQKWNGRAGFAEAMAAVADASDTVKDVRTAILRKSFVIPFGQVKPSGNGFRLDVRYFKETVSESGEKIVRSEIKEGELLVAGQRIYAEYKVWSQENRSYVRLSAPRHACFRPVAQLSGFMWMPYGYREVRTDRTLYWIETLQEEHVTISEEFHVSHTGRFYAPALEIESLYAPHYRATGGVSRTVMAE